MEKVQRERAGAALPHATAATRRILGVFLRRAPAKSGTRRLDIAVVQEFRQAGLINSAKLARMLEALVSADPLCEWKRFKTQAYRELRMAQRAMGGALSSNPSGVV